MYDTAFKAELWIWQAQKGSWHFVTLPEKLSAGIAMSDQMMKGGFGSVKVEVRIGDFAWKTSIFKDKKRGYILPIKAKARKINALHAGDQVNIRLRFL